MLLITKSIEYNKNYDDYILNCYDVLENNILGYKWKFAN